MPLHPVVQIIWNRQQQAGIGALSTLSVAAARNTFSMTRDALGKGPELAAVSDLAIEGAAGEIPCRLYVPEGKVGGVCVYFHGGGWVIGELDDFDALARSLAKRSGCAVLSVDYRLAPENPFPAALEDAGAAVRWAASHAADRLGAHVPLVVAGDSAGGNIAAVIALELAKDVDIKLQVLFNPCLDAAFDTQSYADYGTGYLLTKDDVLWFLSHYAPKDRWLTPRIAPLRSPSLAAAAPAWIGVAEYDLLRDEGEAYAQRLRDAGRAVEFHCYRGVMHGYARQFNRVDVADAAVTDAANAIRRAVAA